MYSSLNEIFCCKYDFSVKIFSLQGRSDMLLRLGKTEKGHHIMTCDLSYIIDCQKKVRGKREKLFVSIPQSVIESLCVPKISIMDDYYAVQNSLNAIRDSLTPKYLDENFPKLIVKYEKNFSEDSTVLVNLEEIASLVHKDPHGKSYFFAKKFSLFFRSTRVFVTRNSDPVQKL